MKNRKKLTNKIIAFNIIQEKIRSIWLREKINFLATLFLPRKKTIYPEHFDKLEMLKRNGYVILENIFNDSKLESLREKLISRNCYDPWRAKLGIFPKNNVPLETNNARIVDIFELDEALEIANNHDVINIVSNYLGAKPTIDDIAAWWSIAGRAAPYEEQFYHRDNDAIKFVKLFVYMSDVEEGEGEHEMVIGSHTSNKLIQNPRRRYLDEEVIEKFGKEKIIKFTGPKYTVFLEDTFSLHKGNVPKTKDRLLFQVRYTSIPSQFVRKKTTSDTIKNNYDSYTNRYVN